MLNRDEVCLHVVTEDGTRTVWYNAVGEIVAFRYDLLFTN